MIIADVAYDHSKDQNHVWCRNCTFDRSCDIEAVIGAEIGADMGVEIEAQLQSEQRLE